MAGGRVRIDGLRELERALAQLPKATGKNVLRRVLRKAGEPIAKAAQQKAPVLWGDLKASIHVSTKKPVGHDAGKVAFREALQGGASRGEAVSALRAAREANPNAFAEAFVGPGRHPQAIQQEFGNVNHPPQPFLRPAWDAEQQSALDSIKDDLWKEIEKSAKRLARKQQKQTRQRLGLE